MDEVEQVFGGGDESEAKFENVANTQFKFRTLPSEKELVERGTLLAELCGLRVGVLGRQAILDEYYDDREHHVARAEWLFRHRRVGETEGLLTVKDAGEIGPGGSLVRWEGEWPVDEVDLPGLAAQPSLLRHFLEEAGCNRQPEWGPLTPVLTVKNRRVNLPLESSRGRYRLSLDRYRYYSPEPWYSEYFSEIEIEVIDGEADDPDVQRFQRALTGLLGFERGATSKFVRGMAWREKRGVDIRTVYGVGFDIVGYSLRPADLQKQLVQKLNQVVKKAAASVRGEDPEDSDLYIPTGDGMFVLYEDRPETIMPIVAQVQSTLRDYNRVVPARAVEVRMALHAGPVFRYADVNENPNIAGDGINYLARLLGVGDAWHIIASAAARTAFGETSRECREWFHPIASVTVKHGVQIDVFNVWDEVSQVGNDTPPTP